MLVLLPKNYIINYLKYSDGKLKYPKKNRT